MAYHPPDWLLNSAVVVGALSLVALVIRMIGPWRSQITAAEDRLRKELIAERARCEAELRIVRHRERGSRQLIYSMLHLVEMPHGPKREGAMESVRHTLAEMERVEAMQAGLIMATIGEHFGHTEGIEQ